MRQHGPDLVMVLLLILAVVLLALFAGQARL